MYAPLKPSFDGAIPFLWMMAVGTVACASVWTVAVVGEEVRSTHAQKKPNVDRAELLQNLAKSIEMSMWQRLPFLFQPTKQGDVSLGGEENPDAEVVELQTKTALVFIITSSLVLLFLFFFNSSWSAWLLVFLFCLGGVQVHTQ